jgi:hypothetical protein
MKKFLVIAISQMMLLGSFTLTYSQEGKGNLGDSLAKPAPQSKVPKGARVGDHIEGIGDRGSFRLLKTRDLCRELIASVQVRNGQREVFIDEVMLHLGARRAMKRLGFKDYATLNTLMTKQLIAVSSISPGDNTPNGSRWPWKCVFFCRIHQECEDYDWIGF